MSWNIFIQMVPQQLFEPDFKKPKPYSLVLFLLLVLLGSRTVFAEKTSRVSKKARPTNIKVAVCELNALGFAEAMQKNLELLLRNSIATIDGFDVIKPIDIYIALNDPKNRAVAECRMGSTCAVKIGSLVRADRVVFGTVSNIGDAYSLNIRIWDVKENRELAREQAKISGRRDLLIPQFRLAAFRLVAPEKIKGALLVDIDVAEVCVELDGVSQGVTPLLKPIENIEPGAHLIVLKREGYSEFQQEINIKPFETTRLKLQLKQAEKKK